MAESPLTTSAAPRASLVGTMNGKDGVKSPNSQVARSLSDVSSRTSSGTTNELEILLQRRRSRCEDFEAKVVVSAEPVSSKVIENTSHGYCPQQPLQGRLQASPPSVGTSTQDDLRRWMEKMRARCQVMESSPESSFADVLWSDSMTSNCAGKGFVASTSANLAARKSQSSNSSEVRRGLRIGSSRSHDATDADRTSTELSETFENDDDDERELWNAEDVEEDGHDENISTGSPEIVEEHLDRASASSSPENVDEVALSSEARRYLTWVMRLTDGVTSHSESVPDSFLELLKPHLSCNSDSAGDATVQQLAAAFFRKHVKWWPSSTESGEGGCTDRHVFTVVAQLLRYHFPACMQTIDAMGEDSFPQLAEALEKSCAGSPAVFTWSFLMPGGTSEMEACISFCDRLVLEGRDRLVIFVIIILLAEGLAACSEIEEEVITPLYDGACSRMYREGCSRVDDVLAQALQLHATTPLSLLSRLSCPETEGVDDPCSLPISAVSAEEVMQHVYVRGSSNWRFAVIDVRSGTITSALPVCIRIGGGKDRQQVAEGIPFEENIHLCFMADSSPKIGDDAIELALHLTHPPRCLKHISVIAGGWESVLAVAESTGYDLTQVETQKNGRVLIKKVGRIAQRARKSLSKTFSFAWEKSTRKQTEGQDKLEKACPREYEIDFAEGPLGFDVSGDRVIFLDADGQAVAQGVKVGDRVVAVAGQPIPAPARVEDSDPEAKLKRAIKKAIKGHARPVRLTFESGS